ARGQIQAHQRVHGLGRRLQDVDKPLVRAHLELLPGVLVNVRRTQHGKHVPLRRKGDGPRHRGAGALSRLHDALGGTVQQLVVKSFQPDADFLCHIAANCLLLPLPGPTPVAPPGRRGLRRKFPRGAGAPRGQPPASSPPSSAPQPRILVMTPAPTVRPPSRTAKRRPSSSAMGVISSTVMVTLSPGITISVPSGSCTAPVTSVVRK